MHRLVECDLRLANNVGIMCENRPEWVITGTGQGEAWEGEGKGEGEVSAAISE